MSRRNIHFCSAVGLFVLFVAGVTAQRPQVECPGRIVTRSQAVATDGDVISFEVWLGGGNLDLTPITYNWTIDRGKIVGGQGTSVVLVDTTNTGPAGSI